MHHRHGRKRQRCCRVCGDGGIETRLGDLVPGQRAKILRVGGRGRARRRFMEMGLVHGETILVERVAPLGDPIEFLIKGYHLSLRRSDAQYIAVEVLRDTSGGDIHRN